MQSRFDPVFRDVLTFVGAKEINPEGTEIGPIPAFSYSKFLKAIDSPSHMELLKGTRISDETKLLIVEKMQTLARGWNQNKRPQLGFAGEIFHKMGQLFKGHGFQTKGDYGWEITRKINSTISEDFRNKLDLEENFRKQLSSYEPISDQFNKIDNESFRELVNKVYFKEANGGPLGAKTGLYTSLSNDKRAILIEELIKRDDWVEHIESLIGDNLVLHPKNASEIANSAATEEVCKKFVENFDKVMEHENKHIYHSPASVVIFQKYIKIELQKENPDYKTISNLIHAKNFITLPVATPAIERVLSRGTGVLTSDEIEKVKNALKS